MNQDNNQEIRNFWNENQIYKFSDFGLDFESSSVFSIDTPPPTISGNLHMGHIFSYTHTDIIARFQRMKGQSVFYPIGFDDNGLPTEKLIEKKFNKRARDYENKEDFKEKCETVISENIAQFENLFDEIALSFDKGLKYRSSDKRCSRIAVASFFDLYQKQKVYFQNDTVFWDYADQTAVAQAEIDEERVDSEIFYIKFFVESDDEFLDELGIEKLDYIEIATTRPELLGSARCIFVHPDDLCEGGKFFRFKGKSVITPVFWNKIPVLSDERVVKEKGSGAVMCCFFGDELDVSWFKKYRDNENSPENHNDKRKFSEIFKLKETLINKNGFINFSKLCDDEIYQRSKNAEKFQKYFGLSKILKEKNLDLRIKDCRSLILNLLKVNKQNFMDFEGVAWEIEPKSQSSLFISSEPFVKILKKAERSGCEIEILSVPQWYISLKDEKDKWLELSEELKWFPANMIQKLKAWILGLEYDWCISRQRFWGIRFPVIFVKIHNKELILMFDYQNSFTQDNSENKFFFNDFLKKASIDSDGVFYTASQDFIPEYDVFDTQRNLISKKGEILISKGEKFSIQKDENIMDTWFTSSLSPQINSYFREFQKENEFSSDLQIFESVLDFVKKEPKMDLRPQAHEILRTWAFYSIVKSFYHSKSLPWMNIMISGWCLSTSGEKMSKSKGNIIDPKKILSQYSADAIRYWAASSNLGSDTRYDENVLKQGRKLVLKIENVFKFLSQFKEKIKEFNLFDLKKILGSENLLNPDLELIDFEFLKKVDSLISGATIFFSEFNYFKALSEIEDFFWKDFCDNFIEISKVRAYGEYDGTNEKMQKSALWTLCFSFFILLKLLSPFLPFISEKIFLELGKNFNNVKSDCDQERFISIHSKDSWPLSFLERINFDFAGQKSGNLFIFEEILNHSRRFKALRNLSQKEKIKKAQFFSINADFFEKNLEFFIFDLKNVCQFDCFECKNFKDISNLLSFFSEQCQSKKIFDLSELTQLLNQNQSKGDDDLVWEVFSKGEIHGILFLSR